MVQPVEIARLNALIEEPLRALRAALGQQERRVAWEELSAEAMHSCESLRVALGEWATALARHAGVRGHRAMRGARPRTGSEL